ncbi:LIC_12238 family plasminogen-binding lipoprotein, partial [Leptospira santarosai]
DVIDEVEFLVRSTRTPYTEDAPSPSDNDIEKAMK